MQTPCEEGFRFVKDGEFPKELAVLNNSLFDTRQESDMTTFLLPIPVKLVPGCIKPSSSFAMRNGWQKRQTSNSS